MIDLHLHNNEPFEDYPFTEFEKPKKGYPLDSEGAEDPTELEIDNQVGGFAE